MPWRPAATPRYPQVGAEGVLGLCECEGGFFVVLLVWLSRASRVAHYPFPHQLPPSAPHPFSRQTIQFDIPVHCVAISPSKKHLYCGLDDGTLAAFLLIPGEVRGRRILFLQRGARARVCVYVFVKRGKGGG